MESKNFQAVFYRDPEGAEPVSDFIDRLEEQAQVSIDTQIDRLNLLHDAVPHLPFPHSSQVEGELRELRCHHGRRLYRVLYRRSGRLIILLHIFAKRVERIPEPEKRIARERWDDFQRRMNATPRIPPRAAGHDAPERGITFIAFAKVLSFFASPPADRRIDERRTQSSGNHRFGPHPA